MSPPAAPTGISTRLGAAEIARRIAAREMTARQVVDEHLAWISRRNPALNAIVVRLDAAARRDADLADAQQRAGGRLGPLHGVPITVKECFHVRGTPSTMGLSTRTGRLETEDGELVAALRGAGAIVLGKTNVPQMMLWHECENPVYGRTNHPFDPARTCGGSSGGEAAIVAAGGSPLGLASDMGGSVRIPAHFCGCVGFIPTTGRLPTTGCAQNFTHVRGIQMTPGFIARRVDDVRLAWNVVAGGDQAVDRNDTHDLAGLGIGVWESDGFFPPAPAVARATHEAATALANAGARVVEFSPPPMREALRIYFGLMDADSGDELRALTAGDRLDPRVKRMLRYSGIRPGARPPLAWLLRRVNRRQLADLLTWTGRRSAAEVDQLVADCDRYRHDFSAAMDRAEIEAIVMPPHALAAFPHGLGVDLLPAGSYAFSINLLGYPAGVVPMTRVRPEEACAGRGENPLERLAFASQRGSAGLPVGAQIVARKGGEQTVLAVLAELERVGRLSAASGTGML